MLTARELQSIAREMRAAQADVRQIEPFTSRFAGFDLASAYAVAQILHEARVADGAVPVGRKIGFTNSEMWDIYGVREPIWAHVYDRTVARPAAAGSTCSLGRFAEPKIEPEIVFHFHSAPPAGAGLAGLLASIDWVAPAFEIVQSHFPGWRFQAADTVADWALHGALLLGEAVPVDRIAADPPAALASFSVELSCNGERRELGKGSKVLGSPLAALAHLVTVLEKQPQLQPIQAGEIVTTGTITTARSVRPGEFWQSLPHGIALDAISVEFVA